MASKIEIICNKLLNLVLNELAVINEKKKKFTLCDFCTGRLVDLPLCNECNIKKEKYKISVDQNVKKLIPFIDLHRSMSVNVDKIITEAVVLDLDAIYETIQEDIH